MNANPVWTSGPESGPALLLLHGFLGTPKDWRGLVAALPECRCIAPALPGHGDAPLGEHLTHARVIEDLLQLLDAEGVDRCAVLGYSMGGRIAWQLALRSPQRVRLLIAESANPGIANSAEREARARHDDAMAALLANSEMMDFLDNWYAQPVFSTLNAVQKSQLMAARSGGNPHTLAAALRALSVGRQENLWPRLQELRCPIHLIAGEEDTRYREIAKFAPGQAHIFPYIGHTVHLEAPAEFASCVRGILKSVDSDGEVR